jgi:hypothetical protein
VTRYAFSIVNRYLTTLSVYVLRAMCLSARRATHLALEICGNIWWEIGGGRILHSRLLAICQKWGPQHFLPMRHHTPQFLAVLSPRKWRRRSSLVSAQHINRRHILLWKEILLALFRLIFPRFIPFINRFFLANSFTTSLPRFGVETSEVIGGGVGGCVGTMTHREPRGLTTFFGYNPVAFHPDRIFSFRRPISRAFA